MQPHYGFMGNVSTLGDHEATHADDYAIVNDYLYPMVWLKHITVGGGATASPPRRPLGALWQPVDGFGPEHHVSAEALQAYPYRRPGPGPSRVETHARFIAPGSKYASGYQ